jgi:hypothetical protein
MSHSGSSPTPFDGIDFSRLAGPEGSHPLEAIRAEDLLVPSSSEVEGEIAFDQPAVVGVGLTGSIRLRAVRPIHGRGARLRLLGLKLAEERKSRSEHRADGSWTSEDWVEANGALFVHDAFLEPSIPPVLEPGQAFETRFAIPMPSLGPPSGHLPCAIVAWAVEVRWDVALASDAHLARLLRIAQNRDLIRAGVGRQGGAALLASIEAEPGASISVPTALPAPAGTALAVQVRWPLVPSGRSARVELVQHVDAPNGGAWVVGQAATTVESVRDGAAIVTVPIPPDAAPSFDGAGLACAYTIRVVIDRPMRPDASIERPVAVA